MGWRVGAAVLAMLALALLGRIPFLGGLVIFAALLAGIGAIMISLRPRAAAASLVQDSPLLQIGRWVPGLGKLRGCTVLTGHTHALPRLDAVRINGFVPRLRTALRAYRTKVILTASS